MAVYPGTYRQLLNERSANGLGLPGAAVWIELRCMKTDQIRADLERIVARRALRGGETLSEVLGRLDGHAASGELPGRLEHYLQKRSYQKALAWLDEPEAPHHP